MLTVQLSYDCKVRITGKRNFDLSKSESEFEIKKNVEFNSTALQLM